MLKRVLLDSSRILSVATAIRASSSSATPGYVGFKASSAEDSVKIDAHFNKDHFVLEYRDTKVKVSKDFPYVWLRDRCRCALCFNQKTQENDITPFVLTPLNMIPANVSLGHKVIEVTCKWSTFYCKISDFASVAYRAVSNCVEHLRHRTVPARTRYGRKVSTRTVGFCNKF